MSCPPASKRPDTRKSDRPADSDTPVFNPLKNAPPAATPASAVPAPPCPDAPARGKRRAPIDVSPKMSELGRKVYDKLCATADHPVDTVVPANSVMPTDSVVPPVAPAATMDVDSDSDDSDFTVHFANRGTRSHVLSVDGGKLPCSLELRRVPTGASRNPRNWNPEYTNGRPPVYPPSGEILTESQRAELRRSNEAMALRMALLAMEQRLAMQGVSVVCGPGQTVDLTCRFSCGSPLHSSAPASPPAAPARPQHDFEPLTCPPASLPL